LYNNYNPDNLTNDNPSKVNLTFYKFNKTDKFDNIGIEPIEEQDKLIYRGLNDVKVDVNRIYYEKYIKYKIKYLQLKKLIKL
jgi:hypothetical protein